MAGLWEQIWLWYALSGAAGFLALVLFIASLCVLEYAAKNAKAHKWNKVGILDYVLVLALLFFVYFFYVVGIASFGFGCFGSQCSKGFCKHATQYEILTVWMSTGAHNDVRVEGKGRSVQ